MLSRREAIDFLHMEKGYSRRLSAKLTDLVLADNEGGAMFEALKKCLESGLEKKKEKKVKYRYVVKK